MDEEPILSAQQPSGIAQATDTAIIAARLGALPGKSVTVGPLTIAAQVDPDRAQALITASLGSQVMACQTLTIVAPTMSLDYRFDTMQSSGSLTLEIAAEPAYSALVANVIASAGGASSPFQGEVTHWVATAEPVVAEFDIAMTPDITGHTDVRGLDGATVNFSFVYGSLTMGSQTVTQLSPTATFGRIIVGTAHVAAGATITLTIPTNLQLGMLFLQASFPNEPAESQVFSSAVANWALP